jgi:hypothetical protein
VIHAGQNLSGCGSASSLTYTTRHHKNSAIAGGSAGMKGVERLGEMT